jgi:hypothetical protein
MTIWYILCSFGAFFPVLVFQEKSGNTGRAPPMEEHSFAGRV